ncbi:hypothetical protein [Anatilimnocola floriformis]|uniref:hypothetical protein n=1 Tax=Anatilimnocola floriformis TaxID=2948575 RepID=UPI0020C50CF1|nr:hypothetical protein [Anatilimnocola floriformis]
MPTLIELQNRSSSAKPRPAFISGEELVADRRATISPSQHVDRKVAAYQPSDGYRSTAAVRPRAK